MDFVNKILPKLVTGMIPLQYGLGHSWHSVLRIGARIGMDNSAVRLLMVSISMFHTFQESAYCLMVGPNTRDVDLTIMQKNLD